MTLYSVLTLCLCLLSIVFADDEWIQTPHGLRPKECVINHNESDVVIDKVAGGLMITYPSSNRTIFHKSSTKCIENAREIIEKYKNRMNNDEPMDGWEIYAHFGQSGLGRFDSEYIVPDQTLPLTNQLLYYFIGLTNFVANNETIIQPVIAWCGSSNCGFSYQYSGWEMAAWNCCPSGLSNYGKGIKLSGGDAISTYVVSDPNKGNIQVYMSANNGVSSLNENGDYRLFNDAEIAGEFYRYTSCNQFNSVPVEFKKMSIEDVNGKSVDIPPSKWTIINSNPLNCGGTIKIVNNTYATIAAAS